MSISSEIARIEAARDDAFDEIPAIESKAQALLAEGKNKEASEVLNQYTSDFAASTRQAWKEMENKFWYWFGTGF